MICTHDVHNLVEAHDCYGVDRGNRVILEQSCSSKID